MLKRYNIYYNLGYWFLLLIILSFIGFYTTYFSVIFRPTVRIVHIHFILMMMWMLLLVVQPFLIKYKKPAVHRMLGKISYVLVPLVLTSAFLMLRHGYYRDLNLLQLPVASGKSSLTSEQIFHQVRMSAALPFIWFTWFIVCYLLAIINRRKSNAHARFMLATGLSLFGPIIDRIVFQIKNVANYFPPETGAFLLADIILLLLLWKDYKDKRPLKTLTTCLLIYIVGQALYFTIPPTSGWQHFVAFVMKPSP